MNGRLRMYVIIGVAALVLAAVILQRLRLSADRDDLKVGQEPTVSVFISETGEKRTMPIETYIEGVVAGEMREGWPVEAYAAQAILARSFTMDFLERGGTRESHGTDISTDPQEAQAYNASNVTSAIKKAVQMTRGEVMVYRNRFVRAWFHSYSGGVTASAKEGLAFGGAEPPYLRTVRLPENKFVPADLKHWVAEYPVGAIPSILGVNTGSVRQIKVLGKGPSGRATTLRIIGDAGSATLSGPALRLALDPLRVKSTLLTGLRVEGDTLIIEGKGFGHGVGLSQWDALMLAKQGKEPEEIVRTFFKGVEIRKLWD